jgi:hypothetical protein
MKAIFMIIAFNFYDHYIHYMPSQTFVDIHLTDFVLL